MPSNSPDPQPLLPGIQTHADLLRVPEADLPRLADEIRQELIRSVAITGGHLGPNLGVVELSIALHRVFHTPQDKILFDVSHQAYVHKMLTGRADRLNTIRQHGGLSGFCKRSESEHDAYGAGHAGTALSAALGMCSARDLLQQDYHVIAVAGDAAFTCGTTLEALNNIDQTTKRLIVILNDNEWAIDKNVGALSKYFSSLQTSKTYTWLRDAVSNLSQSLRGEKGKKSVLKLESMAKNLVFPSLMFHQFGLRYFGPFDGHDIPTLIRTLSFIKQIDSPVIVHVITQKGKGFQPALNDPAKFHGVGSYDVQDGETPTGTAPTYSQIFGDTLTDMARQDARITAITAAMPGGTGLATFKETFPERYVDVGIAEEHGALFACGQAAAGLKPYVAIYSTFMQRCVDMIQHDAALQQLPVRFCMDRAGLSPDDGPTHHGLFDIAMIRNIPGIVFMQPQDEAEFVHMLHTMNAYQAGPCAIRYPRGKGTGAALPQQAELLPIGKAHVLQQGEDVCLLSLGNMITIAQETARLLEERGYSVALVNARFIKPLDADCIAGFARTCKVLCTFEDHVITGGFHSAVLESLAAAEIRTPVEAVAWPDQFIEHGAEHILRQKYGITAQAAVDKIMPHLQGA